MVGEGQSCRKGLLPFRKFRENICLTNSIIFLFNRFL